MMENKFRYIENEEIDLQEVVDNGNIAAEFMEFFPQYFRNCLDFLNHNEGNFSIDCLLIRELQNTDFVKEQGRFALKRFVDKIDWNNVEASMDDIVRSEIVFVYLDKQLSLSIDELVALGHEFMEHFTKFRAAMKSISIGEVLWGINPQGNMGDYDSLEDILMLKTMFGTGDEEIAKRVNPIYTASMQSGYFKSDTIHRS